MATETFSICGAPRSFCTCGEATCRGDCNLLPVEDVSDLIVAGVWEERQGAAQTAGETRPKHMAAKAAPPRAESFVEDAADLFAAGVWEHKLM